MGQFIYNFFWWIAGANREILKKHIGDHNKYFQMGVTIFITATLATFTGGYALNYALTQGNTSEFTPYAIVFGLFWGFIILNLDRFIIVTMRKRGTSLYEPTSYEKWQDFKQELIPTIPRLFLAILISIVVLNPFELYLFKEQITHQAQNVKKEEIAEYKQEREDELNTTVTSFNTKIQVVQREINGHNNAINRINNRIKDLQNPSYNQDVTEIQNNISRLEERTKWLVKQMEYEEHNASVPGRGEPNSDSNYNRYRRELNNKLAKISQYEQDLNRSRASRVELIRNNQEEINRIKLYELETEQNKLVEKQLKREEYIKDRDGEINATLANIKAYEKLYDLNSTKADIVTAFKAKGRLFDKDNYYYSIHYVLMLLIFTLEILPVFLKILSYRGSYEAEIQRISEEEAMKHDTFIRDKRYVYNMQFKALKLEEGIKTENLNNKLRNVKFS